MRPSASESSRSGRDISPASRAETTSASTIRMSTSEVASIQAYWR
jgi:hypothetical protein